MLFFAAAEALHAHQQVCSIAFNRSLVYVEVWTTSLCKDKLSPLLFVTFYVVAPASEEADLRRLLLQICPPVGSAFELVLIVV